MTTDTAPIVAALRRLAEAEEAEEACPDGAHQEPGGYHLQADALPCSGRVPLLRNADGKALFRKACHGIATWKMSMPGREDTLIVEHGTCCRGLGWLPLDVGEVHLEDCVDALYRLGAQSVSFTNPLNPTLGLVPVLCEAYPFRKTFGANCIEAALLALDAAMDARG